LLALTGPQSLLQLTIARVLDADLFEPFTVIAGTSQGPAVLAQLTEMGAEPAGVVLEPVGRNTAAAAAVAALVVQERDPSGVLLLMPSDHRIADNGAFAAAVRAGLAAAQSGSLVLFGIKPTTPATGYGYIRTGGPLNDLEPARQVQQFLEKPAIETAQAFLAAGEYLWNSGIFLLPAAVFLDELAALEPDILRSATAALSGAAREGKMVQLDAAALAACPSRPIDTAVMERTTRAAVVPVEFGWTDVGSWSALWDITERDSAGNAVSGEVVSIDTTNSLLRSEGPTVATIGLDNVVVVATEDAILIADRSRDQEVKAIVERLRAARSGRH